MKLNLKLNIGAIDRLLRMILGIIFLILIITVLVSGIAKIILGILALGLIATSIMGSCPVYLAFNISTKIKKDDIRKIKK